MKAARRFCARLKSSSFHAPPKNSLAYLKVTPGPAMAAPNALRKGNPADEATTPGMERRPHISAKCFRITPAAEVFTAVSHFFCMTSSQTGWDRIPSRAVRWISSKGRAPFRLAAFRQTSSMALRILCTKRRFASAIASGLWSKRQQTKCIGCAVPRQKQSTSAGFTFHSQWTTTRCDVTGSASRMPAV